jgi:hypothetical protein
MYRRNRLLLAAGAASLAVATAWAVDRPGRPTPAVPAPANRPAAAVPFNPADFSKTAVEAPAEKLVARTAPAPASADGRFVNPKVEPGKVRWHADLDAACKAARRSGKPVLLFQMMGKLDEKFC